MTMFERQSEDLEPLEFSQYFSFVDIDCHDELPPALAPSADTPMLMEAELLSDAVLFQEALTLCTVLEPL
ncbi:hypothetical protein PDENDC454_20542 [Paenibacillus dendritiformis C454]|uniref:Uncharacterized protein n=1 Tax=Paenibacillus dendritiformis C454 TaxID=1131935 RepID=H3SKK9_9BACL|nr:hypothetical protein PDENDC454_20542 [Paenibacillus dendritiformis C454]